MKENEIVLYIQNDSEINPLELIINSNATLIDLWNSIKQELKMNPNDNEYHLCEVKTSLINDGQPLNDFDQTLTINGLTNGAQLAIRSGSIPPRNHLRLKLFRIIHKFHTPAEASKMKT